MSLKCENLPMGWENMSLYNVGSTHQTGDNPSNEVARWRSHPIWDESRICNPTWQNLKLFSWHQVPATKAKRCTRLRHGNCLPMKMWSLQSQPCGRSCVCWDPEPGHMFLAVNMMHPARPMAHIATGSSVSLSSAHRHDGKCSWPPKSSSDFLVAKFQNSHKMWPVLLTSQESPGGNCSPPLPPPHTLSLLSSDQQLPTLAHDVSLVRSRTFPNETHLIYGFLSWLWVERNLGPTCSYCKGENFGQSS